MAKQPAFLRPPAYRSPFIKVPYSSDSQDADEIAGTISVFGNVSTPRTSKYDIVFKSDNKLLQPTDAEPEKQPGIWAALKFSTYKGFVDYAADATDNVLSKIQEAKLGLQSSVEQMTKKSSDPERQAVYNQYNQEIAKATTMQERQAARRKLAEKQTEWATERQYGVAAGEEEFASKTPKLTEARKNVKAYFEPKIEDLTRRADVENEGWFTQVVASAAESAPYTLSSKLSFLGFFLNYGVQEQRSIQEKTMLAQQEGRELSLEDKQNILMNAVGSAVVEAASEHIFPVGEGLGKATVKTVAKFLAVQGIEEGAEEVLSYVGQGFLAKLTTDKNATLLGIAESSGALINLEGAGKSALAGAIMGSVYSTTSISAKAAYKKTKSVLAKHADKPVDQITPEDLPELEAAIREDTQEPETADELFENLSAATVKINQDLPVEKKADNLESVVASLQEKANNQVLQPEEKVNTDAVIQVAQTELKNLRNQQKEAILQSPAQAPTSPSAVEGTSITTPAVETPVSGVQELAEASEAQTVSEPAQEKPVATKTIKPKEFYSAVRGEDGKPTFQKKDGKAIVLESMPNEDFFVYSTGDKKKIWSVVHAKTGQAIIVGERTRKDAIERANALITQFGVEAMTGKINSAIEKFGVTPAYVTQPVEGKQPTTQPQPKTEAKPTPKLKPKVAEAKATKAPSVTVSMADLERKYQQNVPVEELQADIDNWLDSDDPQAQEIRKIKDGSQLAEAVLDWKLNLDSTIETKENMMKVDLQLLALDAWGRRLDNVPKGDAITMHMKKMVDLFRTGQTRDIKNQINDAVSDDMILHRIIGDQQVINEATARMQEGNEQEKIQNRKNLWSRLSISDTFNPVDVIMGDMYAKELAEAGNYHDSMATADLVARKLTVAGRFLRAAMLSGEIHGTNVARKLIRDFNEQVDPTAAPKIENKANETENIINDAKKKALVDSAGRLDNGGLDETIDTGEKILDSFQKKMDKHKIIRDGTKKATKDIVEGEPTEEDSLAQQFADKVVAYSEYEQKPPKELTPAQRLLKQLMTKFKERNPKERVSYKENPLTVLTDILNNRGEYADVWEGAQAILAEATQEEGADFKDDVFTFIDTFLSPTHAVSADKYMKAVIREQLKKSDMTLVDFALQFSMNESVTMSRFFEDLRKAMSGLDDKSFAYLKKYMTGYMTEELTAINDKRKADLRKVKEDKAKKPKHEPEEKLANMIANNIRQMASDAEPRARTAEEELISNLYRKHSDYYGKTKKKPADLYQLITDIVSNRAAYESIWFSARSLLQSYPDLAFSDVYRAMQNFNKPIVAESIMRGVVAQTLKDSGTTLTELAKSYYFVGELAYKNFFINMKNKMPLLSDADVKYLDSIFRPYFTKAMEQRRQQMQDSLVKQLQRSRSPEKDKASFQLALDKLMNAAFRDELNVPELRDIWANRMGLPHLSQEMVTDIYDTMKRVHGMTDSESISDAMFQLNKRLAGQTPAPFADKVLAWMRMTMLLTTSVPLTNMASNMAITPIYNMSDRIQLAVEKLMRVPEESRVSGNRLVKIDNSTTIGNIVLEHSTPIQIDRHLSATSKWDNKKAIAAERRYFKNPIIEKLAQMPGQILNFGNIGKFRIAWLGDRKPFTMHFQRSMANTLSAKNYNDNMSDTQKADIIAEAIKTATNVATVRTFRQKLSLSTKLLKIGEAFYTNKQMREATPAQAERMKRVNTSWKLASRIMFPFVVTPVSLAYETYKLSPYAGIVTMIELAYHGGKSIKTKTPIATETKVRLARQLAQAGVGTSVAFVVGMILSALGYIDLDIPDKEKDKNAWALEGRQRYSIRIPGFGSVNLGWLQPLGTAMFMGASIQQAWGGEVTIEHIGEILAAPFDTLVKSTIMSDILNPFGVSTYRTESETAMDFFTSALFMAAPSIMVRFNRAVDPYQRDIYGGTGWEDFKNRFLTYVPFGTIAIPPKVDVWGNKVRYTPESGALGTMERTFLNFATPFTVRRKTKDPVTDEAIRVYNETGMAEAISAFPAKSFKIKINGESVTQDMTGDKYVWYVAESGKNAYAEASKLIQSATYKRMTDEQKAEALKKVYDEAREKARKTWEKMGGKLPEKP